MPFLLHVQCFTYCNVLHVSLAPFLILLESQQSFPVGVLQFYMKFLCLASFTMLIESGCKFKGL